MGRPIFARALKFDDMNFEGHHLVGFQWPIISQRTGERYTVELTDKGFTCNCVGFNRHGKCKHATSVHDVLTSDDDVPVYQIS